MKHLQATGELDNTLVFYTSDNGHFWAEHGLNSKFLPYREAVEVPLLVRCPGHVAAGAVDDRFVTHVDVVPTILGVAGVTSTPVPLDGWSSIRTIDYQYVEHYDMANPSRVTFRE